MALEDIMRICLFRSEFQGIYTSETIVKQRKMKKNEKKLPKNFFGKFQIRIKISKIILYIKIGHRTNDHY